MRLASIEGLGSLTIGRLARELNVSKSGVFARPDVWHGPDRAE